MRVKHLTEDDDASHFDIHIWARRGVFKNNRISSYWKDQRFSVENDVADNLTCLLTPIMIQRMNAYKEMFRAPPMTPQNIVPKLE